MGENFLLVNTFFGNGRKETFAPAFVCESFSASHFLYFLPTLSPFPTGRGQRGVLPGADSSGIVVLRNKTTVAHYYWPRIAKVYYKGRYFMLRISDKNVNSQTHPTRQWELELENCKLLAGNPKRQWPL